LYFGGFCNRFADQMFPFIFKTIKSSSSPLVPTLLDRNFSMSFGMKYNAIFASEVLINNSLALFFQAFWSALYSVWIDRIVGKGTRIQFLYRLDTVALSFFVQGRFEASAKSLNSRRSSRWKKSSLLF